MTGHDALRSRRVCGGAGGQGASRPRRRPPRRRVRAPAAGGRRAAAADHPDDAGRAAALRHGAAAAAVGRRGAAAARLAAAASAPPAGAGGRHRPGATGGTAVASSAAEREQRRALGTVARSGRSAQAAPLKDAYVYVDMAKGSPARGHTPGDQAEGQAVLAAGRGGPAGTNGGVPQHGHRLSQRVLDVGAQLLRPRQLPVRRHAAVGRADHARGRRDLLQHPLEDERRRPGRSERHSTPRSAPTAASASRTSRSARASVVAWSPNAKPVQQKVDVTPRAAGRRTSPSRSKAAKAAHEQARAALRFVQRISCNG